MSKHLTKFTLLLNRHLQHQRFVFTGDAVKVQFLIGEAKLRLAFFEALKAQHINDLNSQYQPWQKLMEDKTAIVEICEHSSLAVYANLKQGNEDYPQQCWFCYCVIFAQACTDDYKALVQALSVGFVQHYLPVLLPKAKPLSELTQLKKRLNQILAQKYSQRVLVKESFKTTGEGICFSLLLKLPNQKAVELVVLTGRRLKSVRIEAYKKAIQVV